MKIRTSSRPRRALALLYQRWSATRAARMLVAAALVGSLASACDTHSPTGPGSLTNIAVTPNVTLEIFGTQQFTATGTDQDGNVVTFEPEWTVVAGGGAIDDAGMFTAGAELGVFTATVEASSGDLSGTATVTVIAGPVNSIEVTPNPVTLGVGQDQQYTAVGRDAGGNVVPISPTWDVVNGGGSIDALSGLFTAGAALGTYENTVEATSDGISGTATVTVVAGPLASIEVTPNPVTLRISQDQQYTAVGRDAGGNVVPISPTWDVVASGGTIDAESGLFTAGDVTGTYTKTVRATSGDVSGTATVTVIAGPLESITVLPDPVTLRIQRSQRFTAIGRDAGGNLVPISPTAWDVVNGGGTIDGGSGLFTAGTATGTYQNTVRATHDGISGTATVTVVAGPLATIRVTPNPATIQTNNAQQFTATGRDAGNNQVPISPTWSVVNGGGTINTNTGLFTAGGVTGTYTNTVRATDDGISGNATVEVVAAPPPASPLGSAADFGILAGSGISCAISGTVTGASTAADVGSSPTLTINGFPPCTFDGAIPAPAVVSTAKGDLTAAYLAAQGEVCDLDLSGIDLGFYDGSNPLPPGTYCFSTSAGLTGTLELAGDASDTWTFQIGSTLTAAVGSQVILSGGAVPDNVYWAVGSSATLNTNAAFQGNIMSQASVTLQADVSLQGRALAQDGAVDLINGGVSIVKP